MKAVKIDKAELLGIVKENKEKHIADFAEAEEDYKEVVLKVCSENVKLATTGNLKDFEKIQGVPRAPDSYENDYTRAIRMLELSVEDTIEVEQDIFNQLVLDEWSWKTSFSMTNATYKSFL